MVLILDNYDSFTYNLVQYVGEGMSPLKVVRNDKISVAQITDLKPSHIILSPGPCTPNEAGISLELLQKKLPIPVLGVCLGHQSLAQAFGAKIIRAPYLMHGKTSKIIHNHSKIFKNIPSNYTAARYHSLLVEKKSLPDCFTIDAFSEDDLIMAISHNELPYHGIQYHPESIRTEFGKTLIQNFLNL
jgi:para-aminobenzoate synthetase component 2